MPLIDYPFAGHFYHTEQGRVHFIDEGQGEAIVLLHGNPTWSYYYRHLIQILSQKYRVLALDYLGCGLSDRPMHSLYWADHIQVTSEWLAHLNLSSFHMVVHDWGGGIGMGIMKKYFECIKKIALLNTGVFFAESLPFSIRLARMPYVGYFLTVVCDLFLQGALKFCTVRPLTTDVLLGYQWPYRSWRDRQAIYDFVRDIPLSTQHPSYALFQEFQTFIPELNTKCVKAFWGMQDFVFNEKYLAVWQRLLPKMAVKRYGNAGHWILEDAHGEVEKDILKFFQE